MKLSIIIPVFRVEGSLKRCVESVLRQSFFDYEIILVDDGSPDASGCICDELAKNDYNIKVIHKENGGLSDARNAGLDYATGEYLTFIDSDDYLGDDTLAPLMTIIERHPEYDFLEYPSELYYGSSSKYRNLSFEDKEYFNVDEYWFDCKAYMHTFAWNKIYKRDLFSDIRFPVGLVFEDAHVLPLILQKTNIIATTHLGKYYYTYNEGSITSNATGKELQSLLNAYAVVLNKFVNRKDDDVLAFYLQALNIQMEVYCKGEDITLMKYWGRLHFMKDVTLKCNIKILILKLWGIKILCQAYKILNKIILHRY